MILSLEKNIRGGISSVMGDRHVKYCEYQKLIFMVATNLYGHSMSQMLLYDKIEMWHGHPDIYMDKVEENWNTPDESDIGYFVEVNIKCPDNIKEKTKNFPFCPENNKINPDKYNDYMKRIQPKN